MLVEYHSRQYLSVIKTCVNIMLCPQKIKEEVASPKTTKRVRESPAQEPDEPDKVTPKRPKTQVRGKTPTVCLAVIVNVFVNYQNL